MEMSEQATSGAGTEVVPTRSRRSISRRKTWAFRAASLLLAPIVLVCLELALRAGGFGTSPDLIVPSQDSPSSLNHELNPTVEFPYYPSTDLSGPEPRRFQLPKPPGVYRIVFLGGSTVIGFPYTPEVAFPRQVELLLEFQSPGRDVEVLNAGITAMNSFTVADLAEQCLACDPDLVVIHAGHNEFYGPGGPASSAMPVPVGLFEPLMAARRTRLGQAVCRLTASAAAERRDPLEALPRLKEIEFDSAVVAQAATNFRANLERAVRAVRKRGVPVVVSTVGCNLRDQGPLRSVWPASLGAEDRASCERLMHEAEERMGQSDWAGALSQLSDAEAICSNYAALQYRRGQALERSGRLTEANAAFRLARDYDGCRFRAPGSFREICRDVADEFDEGEVYFLDIAAALDEASAPYAPGHNLFLEHVHYNREGHHFLAEQMARLIQTRILDSAWDEARAPDRERWEAALGIIPEDDIAACSLALEVLETSVMQGAVDTDVEQAYLLRRIEEAYSRLPRERQEGFANLAINEMGTDLCASLVRSLAKSGAQGASLKLAEVGTVRRPWSGEAWLLLAQAQARQGRRQDALQSLESALQLRVGWPEAVRLRQLLLTSRE